MALDPEQLRQATERYLAGETMRDIARSINIPEPTLRSAIKRIGVSRPRIRSGPKRMLTVEQEQAIVDHYAAGESVLAISRAIGIPKTTLQRTLTRRGIATRPDLAKHILSEGDRARLAEVCAAGATHGNAARQFGVSEMTAIRITKQHGVKMPIGRRRSCTLNDHAFDVLTPRAAYWSGFLFADGCTREDGWGSSVTAMNLAEKDYNHVVKFRDFLGSSHQIAIRQPGKSSYAGAGPHAEFRVRSRHLSAMLIKRGMVLKRTRVPVPELADSPSFWRGAVDGDGWLGTVQDGTSIYPYIGLSGQIPLLEAFQHFLSKRVIGDFNITPTDSGIWKIQVSGARATEIIHILYEDAVEALDRKNVRAQAIIREDITIFPPYIEGPSHQVICDDRPQRKQINMPARRGSDFEIIPVSMGVVEAMCVEHHAYNSAGGLAVYTFAVMEDDRPVACFAWQPPPLGAARAVCPEAPHAVLALSRMVAVPKNERRLRHISKPLRHQMRALIDRTRWPVLITYSDEGQGHTGHVYKCSGWQKTTRSERIFYIDAAERRVSIPTSKKRRDERQGGKTTLQRWEHWACEPGNAAQWMKTHGWKKIAVPGRIWRSGNPAFTWIRE